MRSMKIFGLLAVSAMALTAIVGTSSASAVATFTASGAGNALSTNLVEKHVITVEGSEIVCEEVAFAGETEGASTTQQIVSPSYKKCNGFVGSLTITTGTCKFEFKAATTGSHATVRLFNCANATEGIKIDVNVPFIARCIVDIPQQSINSAIGYSNPTGTSVRFKLTASGIMNDVTTSTGLCPLKVGTNSTGELDGASDVTAAGGYQYSP